MQNIKDEKNELFPKPNELSRKEKSGSIVFDLVTRRYYFENISDEEIKQLSSGGFSKPLRVQWRITKKCNLRCKHCYLGDKENLDEELDKEDLLKIADKIINEKIFEVLITGGEPTLKEGFYELIEKLSSHCFITIFTNATWEKIPEKLMKFIDDKKNLKFFISIEGPKDIHDKIRE
jgi:MoaA/NifB/PqqE/SkfB family radical SAM enzyme